MKRLSIWLFCFVIMALGRESYGEQKVYEANGSICQEDSDYVLGREYGEPGIGNVYNNKSIRVFCPITRIAKWRFRVLRFGVFYIDSNAMEGEAGEFWCYGWLGRGGIWTYWTRPLYTCSQVGGCPDPTTSFTGMNGLQWADNDDPFGVGENGSGGSFGVSCYIPRVHWHNPETPAASWVSYIYFVVDELEAD